MPWRHLSKWRTLSPSGLSSVKMFSITETPLDALNAFTQFRRPCRVVPLIDVITDVVWRCQTDVIIWCHRLVTWRLVPYAMGHGGSFAPQWHTMPSQWNHGRNLKAPWAINSTPSSEILRWMICTVSEKSAWISLWIRAIKTGRWRSLPFINFPPPWRNLQN